MCNYLAKLKMTTQVCIQNRACSSRIATDIVGSCPAAKSKILFGARDSVSGKNNPLTTSEQGSLKPESLRRCQRQGFSGRDASDIVRSYAFSKEVAFDSVDVSIFTTILILSAYKSSVFQKAELLTMSETMPFQKRPLPTMSV